jgi:histone H1/5
MASGSTLISKLGSVVDSVKENTRRVGTAVADGAKREVLKAKGKLGRKARKVEVLVRKRAEKETVRAKKTLAKAKKTVAREAKAAKAATEHLARAAQTAAGRAKKVAGKVKGAARKKVKAVKRKTAAAPTAQVQKLTTRVKKREGKIRAGTKMAKTTTLKKARRPRKTVSKIP